MHWSLPDGGVVELFSDFIPAAQRAPLLQAVTQAVAWQVREIRIAGRVVLEPRQTAWVGDEGAVYTYSGRRNEPEPFAPVLDGLRRRVSAWLCVPFNSVLCNRYRDGRDSMGLHADAEPELGLQPVIASLSLGATRRFQLRHRRRADARLDIDLVSGSLLVMRGSLQRHYKHGVPKQPSVAEPRVNLTFRRIHGVPSAVVG